MTVCRNIHGAGVKSQAPGARSWVASARLPAWLKRWARRFLALPLLLASTGGADAQAPQRCIVNKNMCARVPLA